MLENAIYTIFTISFIALLIISNHIYVTYGLSGKYIYKDKRKKDIEIHLPAFKTPRKSSGSVALFVSLRTSMRNLKKLGYNSVTLKSHLIDERLMNILSTLARKENFVMVNLPSAPTNNWDKISIKILISLLCFKLEPVNPITSKVVFYLNNN